jgi:hypothetical protein
LAQQAARPAYQCAARHHAGSEVMREHLFELHFYATIVCTYKQCQKTLKRVCCVCWLGLSAA